MPLEAANWAEQTIALAPFRETGYRRLMEAHAAAGNRAEALRVYERADGFSRRSSAPTLRRRPSRSTASFWRRLLRSLGQRHLRPRPVPGRHDASGRLSPPRRSSSPGPLQPPSLSSARRIDAHRSAEQRHSGRPNDAQGDTSRVRRGRARSCHRLRRLSLGHEPHPARHRPPAKPETPAITR